MTKLDKNASSEVGIFVDSGTSPYDLPIKTAADDLEEETATDEPPSEEDSEEGTEEGPSEEQMLSDVENSPGVQWKKYLRPILKIIKDTILRVPIELRNSYTVGLDDDTALGFHIVGMVHFLDNVPADVAAQLDGATLRYDAFITPNGTIGDVDLVFPTDEKLYIPTFRINRNVEKL